MSVLMCMREKVSVWSGESGLRKDVAFQAILGMQEHMSGEVSCHVSRPQMIFQDPYSSLNPSKTIGWLLMEPLRAAGILVKSVQCLRLTVRRRLMIC